MFVYIENSLQNLSPREKAPYVHWGGLDPHTEIYISWETENPTESYVKYGLDSEELIFLFSNIISVHI